MLPFQHLQQLLLIFILCAGTSSASPESCLWDNKINDDGAICKFEYGLEFKIPKGIKSIENGTTCTVPCEETYRSYIAVCVDGKWNHDRKDCTIESSVHDADIISSRQKRGLFGSLWHGFTCLIGFCSHHHRDREAPAITQILDKHLIADPIQTNIHPVMWKIPTAHDNKDGNVNVHQTRGPAPGLTFSEGKTIVEYAAKDRSGNERRISFSVFVKVIRCQDSPPSKTYHNGYYVCHPSSDFVLGTTCRYGCYSGYEIRGPSVRTCEQQGDRGRWSIQEPKCERIQCPDLTMPKDSTLTCSDNSYFKSKCTYKCAPGYDVKPGMSRIRVCTASKIWRGTVPVCIDSQPPKFTTCPSYQTFFTDQDSASGYVSWKEPEATDNSGRFEKNAITTISNKAFVKAGVYRVFYTLEDEAGNRGPDCSFKVVIKELKCSAQYPHPYMKLECPRGYRYGSSCNFTCQSGYGLMGAAKNTKCEKPTSDAKYVVWTFSQPDCHPLKTCPKLIPPGNGALACDLWENGRYCQMQCMRGTDLPPTMPYRKLFVCGDSGNWDFKGSIPACAKIRHIGHVSGRMEIYAYFDGECPNERAREMIKQNFMNALKASPYSEAWVNQSNSGPDNVKVLCGPITVKRSAATAHGSKYSLQINLQSTMDPTQNLEQQFFEKRKYVHNLVQLIKSDIQSNSSALLPFFIIPLTKVDVTDGSLEIDCPMGTFPSYRTYGCVGCVQGTFYDTNTGKCEECPLGKFTDSSGQTECTTCPLHKTTLITGAVSVSQCEDQCKPGMFSASGVEPCSPCDTGHYQYSWGSNACLQCPGGKTTVSQESVEVDSCQEFDIEFTNNDNSSAKLHIVTNHEVANNMTMSFWLKSLASDGNIMTVSVDGNVLFSFRLDNYHLKTSIQGIQFNDKIAINDSMWHQHVIAITETHIQLYYDGISIETRKHDKEIQLNGTVDVSLGGRGFIGSLSQMNVMSGLVHPPFKKCFNYDRGNIISWPQFAKAEMEETFLQIPSECDDEDDCTSNPCVQGQCEDTLGGHTCFCLDGFTGKDCDVNIDDCGGHMCANNATCIDGVSNYTCQCTPQYTGEYCDDVFVHGQWGRWGNWSRCSEECGGGVWNRSRRCDNPLPQNGGDDCDGSETEQGTCNAEDCPVCLDVTPPNNGSFDCYKEDKMLFCNVTCDEGYDFDIPPLHSYECGDENGYVWNFYTDDNPYHRLPNCMELHPADKLTLTYKAEYIDLTCDRMNEGLTKEIVNDVLRSETASVPCIMDKRCQLQSIVVNNCEATNRKERSMTTGFTVAFDNSPTTDGMLITLDDLRIAGIHMNNSAHGGIFTVNRGGRDFFLNLLSGSFSGDVKCPFPFTRMDAFCVRCGPGTYLLNALCEICDRGRYQDETGQQSCKACPGGKTTSGRGAIAATECDVDVNVSDWDVPVAVIAGTVSACCLLTAIIIILLYRKWKTRYNKVKAAQMELETIQRQAPYILPQNTHFRPQTPLGLLVDVK